MVGGMGAEAGGYAGKEGWEWSRVERAVILVSHFQVALLEMEQRSGSSREVDGSGKGEREGPARPGWKGWSAIETEKGGPSSANLLREFTNSRERAGERTSELRSPGRASAAFFAMWTFFASPCRRCL